MEKITKFFRLFIGILLYCIGLFFQFVAFFIPWTDEHYSSLPIIDEYFIFSNFVFSVGLILTFIGIIAINRKDNKHQIILYSGLLILVEFFIFTFCLKRR